jgi:hypothetical protein
MIPATTDTLTPRELASRLNRSTVTLERWRRLRIGPPYLRICGRVLYCLGDVAAWIEQQKQATGSNGGAQ